jgi:hypothetical protein
MIHRLLATTLPLKPHLSEPLLPLYNHLLPGPAEYGLNRLMVFVRVDHCNMFGLVIQVSVSIGSTIPSHEQYQ